MMKNLTTLPNIGKVLAGKLNQAGITTEEQLMETGSENAIIKIASLEDADVCIDMLYALEGAIQGIRWHGLSRERKQELKDFYRSMFKQ